MTCEIHLQLMSILLRRGITLDRVSNVLTLVGLLTGLVPLFGFQLYPLVSVAALVILMLAMAFLTLLSNF